MTKLEVVIDIHEVLIKKYGGSSGIRDQAALESAISRPPVVSNIALRKSPTFAKHT